MRLYLMRHGLAGSRETWEGNDALRPLTKKGQQRTRAAANGLRLLGPGIDTLVTSPLARARQTAEIVGHALHLPVLEQVALSPGFGVEQLASLFTTYHEARGLMLVGHEPDFSSLIGELIAPQGDAQVMLKKGACCALDLPDDDAHRDTGQLVGCATLVWLMTARQLGRIAG